MASVKSMGIEAGFYPDHYEGSYLDIFSHVNFNFLGTYFPSSKKKGGRASYPVGALLAALILKALMPGGAYRSVESRLEKDRELRLSLGFGMADIPSDSIIQQFSGKLEIGLLYEVI
ncbi:MAG: transposase [Promethearchaeota archaeon]